jgi:hypothetical protein
MSNECRKYIYGALCALLLPAYGHPQANPNAKNFEATSKAVVFLYVRDAQGQEHPDGTGFLLDIPLKNDPTRGYVVLVTARHMVDSSWMGCPTPMPHLIAKFNKKDFKPGTDAIGTADYDLAGQEWIATDDPTIDIAYTLLKGKTIDDLKVDNAPLRMEVLPAANEIKLVGVGDTVYSAGLLEHASGTKRNYPVFKFGNVSDILEETLPVDSGCASPPKLMTEWLIAASLVPGNSGSPIVFSPALFQGGRPFILGVQSISIGVQFPTFTGTSDVAGMAPIRPLLESIRQLHLQDADLSKPAELIPTPSSTPTGITKPFPAKPGPLPTPPK